MENQGTNLGWVVYRFLMNCDYHHAVELLSVSNLLMCRLDNGGQNSLNAVKVYPKTKTNLK